MTWADPNLLISPSFLNRAREISDPLYTPTTEDILHSRQITTGYNEVCFQVRVPKTSYFQEFRIFDVGGQRDERRKWIHVFEGIEALLFILSCSDFDQKLREDESINRFAEAIELFRQVWHNGMLGGAGIICFLNKQDILEAKIRNGHSMATFYPEFAYCSPPRTSRRSTVNKDPFLVEVERTRHFIRQQLVQVTLEPPRRISNRGDANKCKRDCYYHFTTATDTDNIRRVFDDVRDMILQQLLSRVDLI